jgi:acetyl esterase/lipase
VCFAGQPHGFVNFAMPAAADAFERIGAWLHATFSASDRRS